MAIETDWNNMAHVMKDNQVTELSKHSGKVLKSILKSLKAQPSVSKAHAKAAQYILEQNSTDVKSGELISKKQRI